MSLINLAKMLKTAKKEHFAVGAFNAIDNHFVDAILPLPIKIIPYHSQFC